MRRNTWRADPAAGSHPPVSSPQPPTSPGAPPPSLNDGQGQPAPLGSGSPPRWEGAWGAALTESASRTATPSAPEARTPLEAATWLEPATEHQRNVLDQAWQTQARRSVSPSSAASSGPVWSQLSSRTGRSSLSPRSPVRRHSVSLSVALARWREGVVAPARASQDPRQRVLRVLATALMGLILLMVVLVGVGLTLTLSAPVIAELPTTPRVPPPPFASTIPGLSSAPTIPPTRPAGAASPTTQVSATPDPYAGLPPDPALPAVFCPDGVRTPTPLPDGQGSCAPCTDGYVWTNTRWTEQQTDQALERAATTYQVPVRLLWALASDESGRREWVVSCSGDAGLLQIKIVQWRALAIQAIPACGLAATTDSPWTLQGNANLGAKLVAWLTCYYGYAGDSGGTPTAPGADTVAWYYQEAHLRWPSALCQAVYQDPQQPEYADLRLPITQAEQWACPYSAKRGDATYFDVVVSTYNEGFGTMSSSGITNWRYVNDIIFNLEHEPQTF